MTTTSFRPGTVFQSTWANPVDSAVYNTLAAVTGTNAITAVGPLSYSAYTTGSRFFFNPQNTNTSSVTISIGTLGVKNITKYGATPLVSGDLVVGSIAEIYYDGAQFQLLNPRSVPSNVSALPGRLLLVTTFAVAGAGLFTPLPNTTSLIVDIVGGGGGGGGAGATAAGQMSVGGGGGGGSGAQVLITGGFFPSVVTQVGAAGAAGLAGASGSAGGVSSFGGFVTTPGGLGGQGIGATVPPGTYASVGLGGGAITSGGGATVIKASQGDSGQIGIAPALGVGGGGNGGSSGIVSGAGGRGNYNGAGSAPIHFAGGGGGGAHCNASGPGFPGGAGAVGRIIVYEFS